MSYACSGQKLRMLFGRLCIKFGVAYAYRL
jgi:hypothetical protein